jgi:hypothetical protein
MRKKWHAGASYSFTSTGIRFSDSLRPDEKRHVALATLEYRYTNKWTFQLGLGSVLSGQLRTATTTFDFSPGLVAAAGASIRVVDAEELRPFVLLTAQLVYEGATTRENGSDAFPAVGYHALDARAGAIIGWNIERVVSPYLLARAFGGPVDWQAQGNTATGTDVHHYQLGAGLVVVVARTIDLFVEGVPLGEQGLAAGAGFSF